MKIAEIAESFITRYSPPGMHTERENITFGVGSILAAFYSLSFFISYAGEYERLYEWVGEEYRLIAGATIAPFSDILGTSLYGFFIAALISLAFTVYRYMYFRTGSMSIYLMRRLPERSLLYRLVLVLPTVRALTCILIAVLVGAFYFCCYLLFTPKGCLPLVLL